MNNKEQIYICKEPAEFIIIERDEFNRTLNLQNLTTKQIFKISENEFYERFINKN